MNKKNSTERRIRRCSRCILLDTYPGIKFNNDGVCSVCLEFDRKERKEKIDYAKREAELKKIVENYRDKKDKYDCVIGVSGGKDSSYVAFYLRKILGLQILAVNFQNGFNSMIAKENIRKMVKKLGIDLFQYRVEWRKLKKIYQIFLRYTGDLCVPCNILKKKAIITAVLENDIPLVFTGVSEYDFTPIEIRGAFENGTLKNVLLKEMSYQQIKEFLIPPLGRKKVQYFHLDKYVKWDEEEILSVIKKELGWKNPSEKGYHRLHSTDCLFYPVADYLMNKKWGFSRETTRFSMKIRTGEMTRMEALKKESKLRQVKKPAIMDRHLKKLGLLKKDIKGL